MKRIISMNLLAVAPLALLVLGTSAHAGRPLAVDDANVNDKGKGHVEVWVARDSDKINTWNVAPAFAPVEGVEVGVSYAKARKSGTAEQAIQAKWRITPSQENGCNVASTLGTVHEKNVGNSPYLVGIMTCNMPLGSMHVNLTRHNPKDEKNYNSWGVAFERPMGSYTPHIEAFADQGGKTTLQMGVKTEIAEGWQLDATVGRDRQNTANVFSLGFKYSF
jgi:hypothetical protein